MPALPQLDLNWFAVLAAALSAFALGGLWYGPLFKKAWCREAGVDPQKKGRQHDRTHDTKMHS
jgi:hypothetical protein